MRKKLFTLILTTSIVVSLLGCGSKEENNADVPEQETAINVLAESDENQNEEIEEAPEVVPEEPVKFDCLDEIRNASPDSGMIQIDDMILQYGSKCSEILEAIEKSECTYTADYNENKLVPNGTNETLWFKKNGESYFSINFINVGSETIELKDCVANIITIEKAAKGNFYYAGFIDEETTYSTVKESMGEYEPDDEFASSAASRKDKLLVTYIISSDNNKEIMPKYDKGYDKLFIYYIFDSNTSELSSVQLCDYKCSYSYLPW